MENTNSGPCIVCLKRLREFGFGKIAFSNNDGNIEIHKISKYTHSHFTSAQRMNISNSHKHYVSSRSSQSSDSDSDSDSSIDKTREKIKFSRIKI